jgi:hypothetical protein
MSHMPLSYNLAERKLVEVTSREYRYSTLQLHTHFSCDLRTHDELFNWFVSLRKCVR